jgi:hypothetical protein
MFFRSVSALALLVADAAATIYYAGVAESGGEFGVYSMPRTIQTSEEDINLQKAAQRLLVLDFPDDSE